MSNIIRGAGAADGQVLKTVRVPSATKGKVIVKRTIVKKVPKSLQTAKQIVSRINLFEDDYSD